MITISSIIALTIAAGAGAGACAGAGVGGGRAVARPGRAAGKSLHSGEIPSFRELPMIKGNP